MTIKLIQSVIILFFSQICHAQDYTLVKNRIKNNNINCVEFYHVYRPVSLGAVTHEFIGALVDEDIEVLGLPKGISDLTFLNTELQLAHSYQLRKLFSECGSRAVEKLKRSISLSESMQKPFESYFYYYLRMSVTPLVGRPCAKAANTLEKIILE